MPRIKLVSIDLILKYKNKVNTTINIGTRLPLTYYKYESNFLVVINNKLINTKNSFVKTKEEYKSELKCILDEKIKIKSIIDTQHEEIERLHGEVKSMVYLKLNVLKNIYI